MPEVKINKNKKRIIGILLLLLLIGIGWTFKVWGFPPWEGGDTEDGTATVLNKTPEKPEIPEWQKQAFQRGLFGAVTQANHDYIHELSAERLSGEIVYGYGGIMSGTGFYSEVENIAYFSAWFNPDYFWEIKEMRAKVQNANEYSQPNFKRFDEKYFYFPKANGSIAEYNVWDLTEYTEQPVIFRIHKPKLIRGHELTARYNEFYNTQVANPVIHESLNEGLYIEYTVQEDTEWKKDINFVMVLQPDQISTTGDLIDFQGMRKYTFQEFLDSVDSIIIDIQGNEIEINLDEVTFIDI